MRMLLCSLLLPERAEREFRSQAVGLATSSIASAGGVGVSVRHARSRVVSGVGGIFHAHRLPTAGVSATRDVLLLAAKAPFQGAGGEVPMVYPIRYELHTYIPYCLPVVCDT